MKESVGVGVLKIEESESESKSEVLCTDSKVIATHRTEASVLSLDYFFTDKIVTTILQVTHIYDRSCGVRDNPCTC
jgi:hypothetical protein